MNAGSSAGDGGGLGFQAVIFASQAKYAALFATAATTCLLGFALNDSGIAVPAAMIAVAVPWLVAVLVPVVERRR
jgi:hypothetical protein